MEDNRHYNVLFLCTRNATRGILAEALMNLKGRSRFRAFSAGTQPALKVNEEVVHLLARLGIDTESLRSKSWIEFSNARAPRMDFIFTLCDRAAAEQCPRWPGQPVTGLWSIPDPSVVKGTEVEKAAAYRDVFSMLERRISLFLSLPLQSIDRLSMDRHLTAVGGLHQHGAATAVLRPATSEV